MLRWEMGHRATDVPTMLVALSIILVLAVFHFGIVQTFRGMVVLGLGGYALLVPLYVWAQRVVRWDGPRECLCGYVLSGDFSGVCPACGAKLPTGCKNCGYDLTGNVSGVCPECGTPIRSGERAS